MVVAAKSVLCSRFHTNTLYMPCDAGWGGVYTLILIIIARVSGYRIFLHHRSFLYLDNPIKLLAWIINLAGRMTTHIVLCYSMGKKLCECYGADIDYLVLNNIYRTKLMKRKPQSEHVFTLGLLSNLKPEKGLIEFISLVEKLISENLQIKGILAGPAWGSKNEIMIQKARANLCDKLEWWGEVQGRKKERFYKNIDVFIFPTQYINEAQPNVIFEAISKGIPVIVFGRGCVSHDLADAGIVVDPDESFEKEACRIVSKWLRHPKSYKTACDRSFERAEYLLEEARKQHRDLMGRILERNILSG